MVRATAGLALSASLVGLLVAVRERAPTRPPMSGPARADRTVATLALGSAANPHRLVIFTDYECPVCALLEREAGAELRRLAVSGRLRLEVRHFPLTAHRRARRAAALAICAEREGSGWRMHEALLATSARWGGAEPPAPMFAHLVDSLGLDRAAIAECTRDPHVAGVLAADVALGRALGLTGVPALFLDDRPVVMRSPRSLVRRVDRLSGRRHSP